MHEAPEIIKELVEKFERNFKAYKNPEYKEEQLKQEFLNPFFKALGWDVDNTSNAAPQYRDVIFEDSIKVAGGTKAPDYCFTLSGRRMFFVEAKKPSVNLKDGIKPAYQLRRYAWSAKLPLSILTDFEEFAIYESRTRPKKTDRTSTGRIMYLTYKEYVEKWDEIYSIFSYEAVRNGSFDNYAEGTKKKRGTQEVDDAFLSEIETWREILAKNLALRNKELTVEELNYSVQQIIDRIIFLRMTEDRGIEKYGKLLKLLTVDDIYDGFCEICKDADAKYNSGLFNFKEEKGREHPDKLTLTLNIDNGVLRTILKSLYYPDSPYEFSVLSPEILGNVYEQFLGKIIRLTPSHMAKVEEKPEVKKAGGVYYTPQFIVDYIVKNTIGHLCNGSTPNKVSELKILDPACGSGSFLLGAYTYLLRWHLDYYNNLKDKKRLQDKIYKGKDNEWHLTIQEKKQILLNNIYGVDIDRQAVEVTKLSLLLKVLEGENRDVIEAQQKLFRERALPDLDKNIKWGNSIIGPEIYEDDKLKLNENDIRRINAFDWNNEFTEIMANGGFDSIIGNPPYVDIKGLPELDVKYIFKAYESANNRINLFATFIEKSLSITNPKFYYSMIVPTAILTQESYSTLRKMILGKFKVKNIVRLPNESFGAVAGDVKVDTAIIVIADKNSSSNNCKIIGYAGYDRISNIDESTAQMSGIIDQNYWSKADDCIWSINVTQSQEKVLSKIEKKSVLLEEIAEFSLGLTPYDKYKGHTKAQIQNKVFHADYKKDKTFKKLLAGKDVKRYSVNWNGKQWISYGPWLGAPRKQEFFNKEHILVKQIIDWTSRRIWATITDEELYNTQNAFNILQKEDLSLKYILGILNSQLMTFYHRKRFLDEFKMRFQKILIKDCKRFPIHLIDFNNPEEVAIYEKIVSLVDQMLQLNKKLSNAKIPTDIKLIERQIDATDKQIDNKVYELYGLTNEEVNIVNKA